jgi:hypothetical protein
MAPHIQVKIANYCTALEALLSNDTSELTHKLSERAGWLLGRNMPERFDIVQRVRRAYSIRSKVVHGVADWGVDLGVATETAAFLDATLRQIIRLVRHDPHLYGLFTQDSESAKKKYDLWFAELVLGKAR